MKSSLEIYISLSCLWQDKSLLNLVVGSFLLIFPSYLPPILMGYMGIPLRWLLQLCAICRSQFHIPNYPSCSETPLRQTPRCLCESSFWHCWGGEVWEGGQQRWKRLLLKSPRGNGQAGNGRAAQDTRKEERKELGFVREKTAVLSFQTGEHGWAGGSRTVWPVKAELQGWAGLDTSSENTYGLILGFARFIQTTQDYL